MLASYIREHEAEQEKKKAHGEELKAEALVAVRTASEGMMDCLNENVSAVFMGQKLIDREVRKVQTQATKYSRQTSQWLTLLDGFQSALKELGDVENWAKTIEDDMKDVVAQLEEIMRSRGGVPEAVAAAPAEARKE